MNSTTRWAGPLPNFFIAGAPKAGTTSLYHYLDQHPQIYMSPVKEPHYFAPEVRMERLSDRLRAPAERDARSLREYLNGPMRDKRFGGPITEWRDYLKLFAHVDGQKAIGEASVCYLWSTTAAENIQRVLPDARIIAILRNPVEMAFSMYLQNVRSGVLACTFREAIETGLAQRGGPIDVLHPFLDLGMYSEQIRRFLAQFGREQVRIYRYEGYSTDPCGMVADIFQFLGVDAKFRPDMSQRYLEARMPDIAFDAEDRAFLAEFYREDILKLADLLGRDLSSWLR